MKNSKELDIAETLELMQIANRAANFGVFQLEIETQKIYWNDFLKSIFEVSKDFETNLEGCLEFIRYSTQPEQIQKVYCKGLEDKKPFNIEHEIITAKGNKKYIWLFAQPIFKNGKYSYFQGVVMDITQRKNSELELVQKNQYLDIAEDIGKMGYWRWNFIKEEGTWSDNLYNIFEWDKSSKLGFEVYLENVHPDDVNLFKEKIENVILYKKLSSFSHRFILKNGRIKYILLGGQVLTNRRGEVVEIVGTCRDITEDKAKEEELFFQKKRQDITEKISKTGSWQWNIDKDEFKISENLKRLFEFNPLSKINIALVISRIHPDDISFARLLFKEVRDTKESRKFSHRIILKDSSQKILEVFVQPEVNAKGEITHLIGSTQDVSERISAKQTLKKKNKLLDFAEQITTVGYWSWKPSTDAIFWSENLYHIFGKSKDENLNSDSYFNCVHPDDRDYVIETIKSSIKELKFKDFSHRIICDNGTLKTIQIVGEITSNRKGRHIELTGTCLDITESETKTAEIRLKNQQLSISEKMAMIGNWQWNYKTNEIKWSDNLYSIFGHKKTVPITLELYLDYIHNDDKDYVKAIIEESILTKKFIKSNYKIQLKNGTEKVLNSIGKILTNKNGEIIEIIGVCQDITKNKANELQLLHKNQSLSFAEEITKVGSWKWDVKTNEFEWSDNMYKIVGFEMNSTITKEKYLSKVPIEEHNLWYKHVEDSIKNKKFKKLIHQIIKPDNTRITLEVSGKVITDNEGNIAAIFGTSQDITERKQKELELIEKNQQLNLAEEIAMIGCWVLNLKTQKFDWSNNTYRIFDFDIGVPIDLPTLLTRVPVEEHKSITALIQMFIKTKKIEKFTHSVRHRDGSIRIVEVAGKVIVNKENEAIEFIGSSRDITEELKVKQEILAANKNLEETATKLSARNKQLAEFNQISSHNLRAPVGNLNALLNLYKESKNEDEKSEIFSKFSTVIDHLSLTLNTLVESLKIKNNPKQVIQELSFMDTLTKTKEILTAEISNTGAIIRSDFSIKNKINYNQIYLDSIFLNLISNAIKYSSPDRIPEIDIASNLVNKKIMLTIKDNGLGIDLKKHGHKLFGLNKVFHRHPNAQGIGLFLTKAQIETMGGTIYAESEVNIGTTFYITLN